MIQQSGWKDDDEDDEHQPVLLPEPAVTRLFLSSSIPPALRLQSAPVLDSIAPPSSRSPGGSSTHVVPTLLMYDTL